MKKENNNDIPFTMVDAIAYQQKDLTMHDLVLKPEVAQELRKRTEATNPTVTNPWNVCRGCDIDQHLSNIMYELHYGELKLS